jgi:dihydrofolate reductase
MGTLSYTMSISLDGYIEDVTGDIAFSEPDEEVHRFANQQTRETAALLFGRGLYEVMEEFWTAPAWIFHRCGRCGPELQSCNFDHGLSVRG